MLPEILKAYSIGICASAPLGPVAILVLQKSLCYGHKAGFTTGLGATVIDTTYAVISIFALAFAQNFIHTYESFIFLIGGVVLAFLGYSMAFKDPFRKMEPGDALERGASVKDFLQAIATAASNPGAIFVMIALFAFFQVDVGDRSFRVLPLILAVAAGSMTYWFFFSWFFSSCRKAFNMRTILWLNRIAGIIIIIIGIALLGEGGYDLVFHRS
jgi:threonine/homoserine/homoserine lactone efflux protein